MAASMNDIFTTFVSLTDPRMDRTRRHELYEIVVIAICATIAGSDTWADIERFGKERLEWLPFGGIEGAKFEIRSCALIR